jgi:hypothetical protein
MDRREMLDMSLKKAAKSLPELLSLATGLSGILGKKLMNSRPDRPACFPSGATETKTDESPCEDEAQS